MAGIVDFGIFDGLKVINPNSFPEDAWTVISGESTKQSNPEKMFSCVGYVYRCVQIRSDAIASLPWRIDKIGSKSDEPIWDSESSDLPKQFEGFEDFSELLYLTEASLCLAARSYWYKVGAPDRTVFRWLMAETIKNKWDKADGLIGFERRFDNQSAPEFIPREEMVYFTLPNPLHETKTATSPVEAALADAGVIYNMDKFASEFFKRGAIKATLLSVDRSMPERQRKELKAWWMKIVQGVKTAWNTVVLSSDVKATVIGEGLSELSNLELARDKREGISTVLGVPHSIVMSNAASYATATQDVQSFYEFTVVPAAKKIERVLNRDVFKEMGYRFSFSVNSLKVFQEDENQRSTAFKTYVDAGLKKSLAAEMLGINLPIGIEYADLDEKEEEEELKPEQSPKQVAVTKETEEEEQIAAEGKQFKNWAKRRLHKSGFNPAEFDSEFLSNHKKLEILESLGWRKSEETESEDYIWSEDYP